jgi:hypothetical protein
LGLPLFGILFGDRDDLAILITPLLIQHPLQMIVRALAPTPLSYPSAALADYERPAPIPLSVSSCLHSDRCVCF